MKSYSVCYLFLWCWILCATTFTIATHSPTSIESHHAKKDTYLDIVIEELKNVNWDEDEAVCTRQIFYILDNVRNLTLWATRIWDSIQSPVGILYGSQYQLGNFDQCLQMPPHSIPTQYCLTDVSLSSDRPLESSHYSDPYGTVMPYINTLTPAKRQLTTVTWGVCIPASCKQKSITKFSRTLFLKSWLGPITATPDITVDSCQLAGSNHSHFTGYYSFKYLVYLLYIIAVLYIYYVSNTSSTSFERKIAGAFSMDRNWQELMKVKKDEIQILHCLKILYACIIACLHQVYFSCSGPILNAMDLDKMLFSMPWFLFLHIDVVVDTFFMISGLLLVRGFMTKWDKPENPLVSLWKRYIRLLGPLALVVIGQTVLLGDMGSGPLWPRLARPEEHFCRRNWWSVLAMISNFWNFHEMCFPATWYLACDYQLAIAGTTLMHFYRRRRRAGMAAFTVAAVLSILLPAWLTYQEKLTAINIVDFRLMGNFRHLNNNFGKLNYIKPQNHAGPYLVGMATGYLMAVYKIANHQGRISKKWSFIGFTTSVGVALMVLLVGATFNIREYDALESAIFAGTNRTIWSLAISAIIVISQYGHLPVKLVPIVQARLWVPLSRLSYTLYLVHILVINHTVHASRSPQHIDMFSTMISTLGVITFSFLVSLLIMDAGRETTDQSEQPYALRRKV